MEETAEKSMEESTKESLAEKLRSARKRPLSEFKCDNDNWLMVSREIAMFEENEGQWPSKSVQKCLDEGHVPFAALSRLLALAVRSKDTPIIEKIVAGQFDIEDIVLVDAALFAVRDSKPNILQLVFRRNVNQLSVTNRLRQSASIEDCLCLLEEAAKFLCSEEIDIAPPCERSVLAWIEAALDSHFFGFAQRLGFSSSENNTAEQQSPATQDGDLKNRLETVLDRLASFADDRTQHSLSCNNLLTLVENSLACANNRMPDANRYRRQNGKSHRDYAVRMIVL